MMLILVVIIMSDEDNNNLPEGFAMLMATVLKSWKRKEEYVCQQCDDFPEGEFELVHSALGGGIRGYRILFPNDITLREAYHRLYVIMFRDVPLLIAKLRAMKRPIFSWFVNLQTRFSKRTESYTVIDPPEGFSSEPLEVYRSWGQDVWEVAEDRLKQLVENLKRKQPGWSLEKMVSITFYECKIGNYLNASEEFNQSYRIIPIPLTLRDWS